MSFTCPTVYRFVGHHIPILIALVFTLACRQSVPDSDVVANTDLGAIHQAEFEEYVLSLPEPQRSPPVGLSVPEWRRQMLEAMIVDRALEAVSKGDGVAQTAEGQVFLTGQVDIFLAQTMEARLIGEKVSVTEENLRAFYDAHPEEFSHPAQIRVRNIYRRVARDAPPEAWDAARNEMEDLLTQLRRGARFGDLAREHSDSETAHLDGLIGRLDRGKMVPELEEVLWGLDEGEVSEVVKTPVGFQIFKVDAHVGQFKMDFEETRSRLSRRLTREATEAAEETVLQELLDISGATYNPQNLLYGSPDDVLFALEDEKLTVTDFHHRLRSIGFFGARDLPLRRQLDNAVREKLYLRQAEATELADEPEIAARIHRMEHEALISLAMRHRTRAMIETLDEQDLWDFYDSNQARFQTPQLFHLRILTLDFPADGRWYSVYEEIEGLAGEIRAGRLDFAQTAEKLSTDFSASWGGDVGAIRSEALSSWAGPRAQREVLELAPGEVSEPILIERFNTNRLTYERSGYMLVRLEEIVEPQTRMFEEARESVIDQYVEFHKDELMAQIRSEILDSVDAEIYSEHL